MPRKSVQPKDSAASSSVPVHVPLPQEYVDAGKNKKKIAPQKAGAPPEAMVLTKKAKVQTLERVQELRLIIPYSPRNYGILTHQANPGYQYLVYLNERNKQTTAGCFACFPLEFFSHDAASMQCVQLTPAPETLDVCRIVEWWRNMEFPRTAQLTDNKSRFPAPTFGFKVGDYVSFKHLSLDCYGWVSAVITRAGNISKAYLVCAVIDATPCLRMVHDWELLGPSFTFVAPQDPFWSPQNFCFVHAGDPERLSYFEPPRFGFHQGDPVTVFLKDEKTEPVDGTIASVVLIKDSPYKQYHVRLSGHEEIKIFPERRVYGPRVDRLNPDLCPTHLDPDPALIAEVSKHHHEEGGAAGDDAEWMALLADETMQQENFTPNYKREGEPPAAATSTDLFSTPHRDLTAPCLTRTGRGFMQTPYPGVLVAKACARFKAEEERRRDGGSC